MSSVIRPNVPGGFLVLESERTLVAAALREKASGDRQSAQDVDVDLYGVDGRPTMERLRDHLRSQAEQAEKLAEEIDQ